MTLPDKMKTLSPVSAVGTALQLSSSMYVWNTHTCTCTCTYIVHVHVPSFQGLSTLYIDVYETVCSVVVIGEWERANLFVQLARFSMYIHTCTCI